MSAVFLYQWLSNVIAILYTTLLLMSNMSPWRCQQKKDRTRMGGLFFCYRRELIAVSLTAWLQLMRILTGSASSVVQRGQTALPGLIVVDITSIHVLQVPHCLISSTADNSSVHSLHKRASLANKPS
jgi:hypothetical protein